MARYLSLGLTLSLVVSGFAACSGSDDSSRPVDSTGGAGGDGNGETAGKSAGGKSSDGGKSSNGGKTGMAEAGTPSLGGAAGQPVTGAAGHGPQGGEDALGGEPSVAGNANAGAGGSTEPAPAPAVTDFTPKLGLSGEVVTITGTGFGELPADNFVTIGGVEAKVLTASATELTVEVPALAVTGAVKVSVGNSNPSGDANFEVLKDIPRQGLVAFYSMSGDAKDQSGNHLDGTVNGATLVTDRFGGTGHAYAFNGSSDYISLGNPALLQIDTAITLAVWAKASAYGYGQTLVSKLDDAQNAGYRFMMGETGNGSKGYTVYVTSNGTGLNFAKLSSDFVPNTWTLLVFALDGNDMHFDQGDGWVFDANNQRSLTNGSLGELKLGSMSPNGSYFAGSLDDFAIYNRKLTANEIKQLYEQTLSKR